MVTESGKFSSVSSGVGAKYVNPDPRVSQRVPDLSDTSRYDVSFDSSVTMSPAKAGVVSSYVVALYLSEGKAQDVDGVKPVSPAVRSTCFHRVLASLGFESPHDLCRVADLEDRTLLQLQAMSDRVKVYYSYTSPFHRDNHVELVSSTTKTGRLDLFSASAVVRNSSSYKPRVVGVTNLVQFFNRSNSFAQVNFYSGQDDGSFGGDMSSTVPDTYRTDSRTAIPRNGSTRGRDPSVSVPDSRHGMANVTAGVVRPRRRVVAAKAKFNPSGHVQKTYLSSSGVQFNNLSEIYQDMISRDYAQDILVQVFEQWGVSFDEPDVAKYCEDLVWAFIIATTASNKADYNKEFEVPHKSGSVVVNFDVFSRVLAEGNGVTRRQFSRAVADDMRRYISEPENVHLLPRLADRVGCDPQMASLAFDGSTHCTGLTSAQLSFTKLLETRNLFEDDRVLADGASQRLMQGMSSGPRSLISR